MNQIVESSVRSEVEEIWTAVLDDLKETPVEELAKRFFGHLNANLAEMCNKDWFTEMPIQEKAYAAIYYTKFFTDRALAEIPSIATEPVNDVSPATEE